MTRRERKAAKRRRERYQKLGAGSRMNSAHKRKLRVRLAARDGSKCFWCRRPFDEPQELTLDHLTPRSQGGVNHIDNLVLACEPCNTRRKSMPAERFAALNTTFVIGETKDVR